jgi:hypothetical protein
MGNDIHVAGRQPASVSPRCPAYDFSTFLTFGNELLAIPYEYTVG